jgi:plasmid maintenance system killer protein
MLQNSHGPSVEGIFVPCPRQDRHEILPTPEGRYAVNASGNWRITFGWTEDDATDVDLEDYH